jgi:dephospho-CoA kinase
VIARASRVARVALTGGIASGKSYCLVRFAAHGVPTIDSDVLAREAIAQGSAGFDHVRHRFGDTVLGPTGDIDRAALGRLVFTDADARRDLEAIVHPFVYEAIERWIASLPPPSALEGCPFAMADIPLLYETGRDGDFDAAVVVACRLDQQLARLVARNGLSETEARRRIDSQWPLAEKARRADEVIDTSGTRAQTDAEVTRVFERLRAKFRSGFPNSS